MTLDRFRPYADRLLDPCVAAAVRLGLSPNAVSVLALAVAGGAAVSFYFAGSNPRWYALGAVLILANGWLDIVDGELARELETTSDPGDLIDHVFDRYADILILVGLAAGTGRYDLGLAAVTGVLMTSYLGTQAQAVGLGRVYGGLLGRADRLALASVVTSVAAVVRGPVAGLGLVAWLLVAFALVGHLTAIQRFYHAMADLS